MNIPDFLAGTFGALFTGWTGYNTKQIDGVKKEQASDRAVIAGLKQKIDDTYDLVKEVRDDQKRREREPFQDSW